MNTIDIRQKLHHYIETAQEKKVKAIFAMVEDEIEETSDHWNNESFVAELQRRETSYLNGTTKTYTLDQSLSRASQAVKKVKKKKYVVLFFTPAEIQKRNSESIKVDNS